MSADPPRVPATPDEVATMFDLMRAALFVLASRRRTPIAITAKARADSPKGMLRLTFDPDWTIRIWIEEPNQTMRKGVLYTATDSLSFLATQQETAE